MRAALGADDDMDTDDAPEPSPPKEFSLGHESPIQSSQPLSVSDATMVTADTVQTGATTRDPLTISTASPPHSPRTPDISQPQSLRDMSQNIVSSSPFLASMVSHHSPNLDESIITTPLPSSPWNTSQGSDKLSTSQTSEIVQGPGGMRIRFRTEDSNSSTGDAIPLRWPRSLRVEGEGDDDEDSSGDSGLSPSQGSSSDRQEYSSPSPGTIRPQMGMTPGSRGKNYIITAVETAAAGDIAVKSDENNLFIDVNKINDTFSGEEHESEISDADSNDTVIENPNTNNDAIQNYIANKNNAVWPQYLKVVDLERRAYEVTKKLQDPANAAAVDEERRKNEDLQRRFNPKGDKYGFVWCGPLQPLQRRNSTGSSAQQNQPTTSEADGFTPVQRRHRKKRTAHFSSSPEDEDFTSVKQVRKRSKSVKSTERTEVRNFFAALANSSINRDDADPLAPSADEKEEGEITNQEDRADLTVDLSSGEEDKAKEDKEEQPELVDLGSDTDKEEDKGPPAPQ